MTRARILADYVSGGTTAAEFDYLDGVTSNVQTQLDAKVSNATHTGDVTGGTALTIATDAVDIAMLSATGTASSSTYLRGDNSWQTAGSTSASDLDSGTLAPARMSTDTVLQTLYKQNVHSATDTATIAASGTVNSTVYTMDIVSKQASSKFLVSLYLGFSSANGTDTEININQTIGGSTIILPYRASSGDVGYGGGSSRLTVFSPRITQVLSAPAQSSGTTITFSAQFINWHASSTWVPYYNGSHVLMTIMEIAP